MCSATTSRWTAITLAGFVVASLAACDSSDGGGQPASSSDTQASKEFCRKYGESMRVLREGDKEEGDAVLPELAELLESAPDEFREWTPALSEYVDALIDEDADRIEQTHEAAEDAEYAISNHCQIVGGR